ncbi:MAG: hypothetical protein KA419_12690 [Acidobacteria bacterium]|nr:hypothetical protein [Acidobacteriota bacterium]
MLGGATKVGFGWVLSGWLAGVGVAAPPAKPPAVKGATPAAAVAAVRKQAPPGFTVLVEPPFVVAGDEAPETVRRRATTTVKWAVDRLKQDFFRKDPVETLTIWLFKDDASYRKHAKLLFGDTPETPYGYYSARHRALVMNIATGGGTLVHEIVHPFMHANFPACPPWFNEGLGSLFEQCHERDGHIVGLTNWRLEGLQQAIRAGNTVSFRELTAKTDAEFYGASGNPKYSQFYGQSRYLCYYLQEQGLLVKFYRDFTANARADPTGYKTLQNVLGEKDMAAFQKRWERYVLGLRFP